jgi:hypothetical protein
MTNTSEFWKKHLWTLSDADLCAVSARGLHRDELRALLEVVYERVHTSDSSMRRRFDALFDIWHRKWRPFCADCGVDVHLIDEYYSVCNDVWNQAWIGRYRSPIGDGQLCIGCLEARLGRTLASDDFIAVPINDTAVPMSDRLRDRLALSAVGHLDISTRRGEKPPNN